MGRKPVVELSESELIKSIASRRANALPIFVVIRPKIWTKASSTVFLFSLLVAREQLWVMRGVARGAKRDDVRKKRTAYNRRPDVAARRKASWHRRMADPVYRAKEQARGIKKFLDNKQAVYDYRNRRRREDPEYRMSCNLRTYLFQKVGQRKAGPESRFKKLVGCTVAELVRHLESQFTIGMTWDTYGIGGWEIDHIKPCSSFDLTDERQQSECFHFSNLRPLWASENRSKHDKILLPTPSVQG